MEMNDKIKIKGYELLSETFHRGESNDFMLGMMCGIIQSTDEILNILNPTDYEKIDYEKLLKANEKKKFGLTRSEYE